MSADEERKAKMMKEAEDLLPGSSGVYDHVIKEEFGIDDSELVELMRDIGHFRCSTCGWWCEDSEEEERNGESVCEDCNEDIEEEVA